MTDPHIVDAGHAPTPFTADEIRIGCPPGRRIRLLVEEVGAEPRYRLSRFAACDDEGALLEVWRTDLHGQPTEDVATMQTTWRQLQRHASFPASSTAIASETIETPLGRSDCLRYQVDLGDTVETFWFAIARPGMPIRFTTEAGGRVIAGTTMVEDVVEPVPG